MGESTLILESEDGYRRIVAILPVPPHELGRWKYVITIDRYAVTIKMEGPNDGKHTT